MAVGLVQEAVEPAAVGQLVGKDHRDREGQADGEREEPHAVHGREPVIREGHQAVEGQHGERHGGEGDAHGGDGMQTMRVTGGAVGVLGERPAAEEDGEHAEHQDVEADTHEEELLVQEPALSLQDRVMANGMAAREHVRGVRPIPEGVAEVRIDGERNDAGGDDDRQRDDEEFPVTSDNRSPAGIEEPGDHREQQHADQDRDPEKRADEDGKGLAVLVVLHADDGEVPDDRQSDEAQDQEFLPVGGQGVRRRRAHVRIT